MKIDWDKVEAMADAMTDEEAGLAPGEKQFTPKEGRKAYLDWERRTSTLPGARAAERRIKAQQAAARAMRLMREHNDLTQAEIARRMGVKAPCVSRIERFGASTIQSLIGYAKACGYSIRILAESPKETLALA